MIVGSIVSVDSIFHNIYAVDLIDLFEERDDNMCITLKVLRDLVFPVDFNSFELNNNTSVEIVFGLEDHFGVLVGDFINKRFFNIHIIEELQIISVSHSGGIVLSRRGQAHCHEVIIVLLISRQNHLVNCETHTKKWVILCHII